jgi:hypothetical protein
MHAPASRLQRGLRTCVQSIDDFCIFAPPNPGPDSVIGNTEVRRVGSRHVYENGYD